MVFCSSASLCYVAQTLNRRDISFEQMRINPCFSCQCSSSMLFRRESVTFTMRSLQSIKPGQNMFKTEPWPAVCFFHALIISTTVQFEFSVRSTEITLPSPHRDRGPPVNYHCSIISVVFSEHLLNHESVQSVVIFTHCRLTLTLSNVSVLTLTL